MQNAYSFESLCCFVGCVLLSLDAQGAVFLIKVDFVGTRLSGGAFWADLLYHFCCIVGCALLLGRFLDSQSEY